MNKSVSLKEMPKYECFLELSKEYPQLDPASAFAFMTVIRAFDCIRAMLARHFSDHGISEARFLTLIILMFDTETGESLPKSHAEIADALRVRRATVTGIVDSLEKDGFVTRHADPKDRRSALVSVTESGAQFMSQILPDHFTLIRQAMKSLDADELEMLTGLMGKVIHAIGDIQSEEN